MSKIASKKLLKKCTKWSKGPVTVSVTTKNGESLGGYTIKVSTDQQNWTNYPSDGLKVNDNDTTVWAKITDGTNESSTVEKLIDNIDKIPPVITENSVTATADSITFSATDEPSGIIEYKVTESSTAPTDGYDRLEQATNNLQNQEITGLNSDTTYYIWVRDRAGNRNEELFRITTLSLSGHLMREHSEDFGEWWGEGEVPVYNYPFYTTGIQRDDIIDIDFVDLYTTDIPQSQEIWDLSEEQNNTVLCWENKEKSSDDGVALILGGYGGITCNEDSGYVLYRVKMELASCDDLKFFDTSSAKSLSNFFAYSNVVVPNGLFELPEGFVTRVCEDCSSMFDTAAESETDGEAFWKEFVWGYGNDTCCVKNMSSMFSGLDVESLNLNGLSMESCIDRFRYVL